MAYFNYHAKLRQLLATTPYKVVKETGQFAYRFNFVSGESIPIRGYRVDEYMEFLF